MKKDSKNYFGKKAGNKHSAGKGKGKEAANPNTTLSSSGADQDSQNIAGKPKININMLEGLTNEYMRDKDIEKKANTSEVKIPENKNESENKTVNTEESSTLLQNQEISVPENEKSDIGSKNKDISESDNLSVCEEKKNMPSSSGNDMEKQMIEFVQSELEALEHLNTAPFTQSNIATTSSSETVDKVTNEKQPTIDFSEGFQNSDKEVPGDITVTDLKEKIKEILSVQLPVDKNFEDLNMEEIEKAHEENMKVLKQKLRLSDKEGAAEISKNDEIKLAYATSEGAKSDFSGTQPLSATNTVVKSISIKKDTPPDQKTPSLSTRNIEDAKKLFRRHPQMNNTRRKTLIQYNINDLTDEIVQIDNTPAKTGGYTAYEENKPVIGGDEIYSKYQMEKEIVETAKMSGEIAANEEIKVEYIENVSKKPKSGFLSTIMKIITCGMI